MAHPRRNTNSSPQRDASQYSNENNNKTLGGDPANEHANQATSRTGDTINRVLNPDLQPHDGRVPNFGHGPGGGLVNPDAVNPPLPASGLDPVSSEMKIQDQRGGLTRTAATTNTTPGSGMDSVSSKVKPEDQRGPDDPGD